MLDKLDTLKIFCTAAETLKFRETALRLGIAPQMVTRAVAGLEKQLGEMLFQRNTRHMKLTPFGEHFWPQAEQLLADSDALFQQVKVRKSEDISGVVRITLPPFVENHEIVVKLLKQLADYPQLSVEWRITDEHLNIIDEQIDIGVRVGIVPDNRFIVRLIRPVVVNVVASPNLIQRVALPKNLKDLQENFPLSVLRNNNTGRVWPWQFADGVHFFPKQPLFTAFDVASELSAALAGRTFSQLADITVRPYIRSGELVTVLSEYDAQPWQLYLFRPHQAVLPKRVRVVFDLLNQILQEIFKDI